MCSGVTLAQLRHTTSHSRLRRSQLAELKHANFHNFHNFPSPPHLARIPTSRRFYGSARAVSCSGVLGCSQRLLMYQYHDARLALAAFVRSASSCCMHHAPFRCSQRRCECAVGHGNSSSRTFGVALTEFLESAQVPFIYKDAIEGRTRTLSMASFTLSHLYGVQKNRVL